MESLRSLWSILTWSWVAVRGAEAGEVSGEGPGASLVGGVVAEVRPRPASIKLLKD